MTVALFSYLDDQGLSGENIAKRIWELSEDELTSLIAAASAQIPETASTAVSDFQFVASTELSGGVFPCRADECRRTRVSELSYLAALYADRIFLQRPFRDYEDEANIDWVKERQNIITSLAVLGYLRPLFEAGYLEFVTDTHFCQDCYAKRISDKPEVFKNNLLKLEQELNEIFRDEVRYTVREVQGVRVLECAGPPALMPHGSIYVTPPPGSPIHRFISQPKPGTVITRNNIERLGINSRNASDLLHDFLSHCWHAKFNNAHLVSNQDITQMLEHRKFKEREERLVVPKPALNHALPLVKGAKLENLVRLRQQEESSFNVYRDTMKSLLSDRTLSYEQLENTFKAHVVPEINKIENRIRNSERLLKNSLRENLVFGTGYLAVSMLSVGFSADLVGLIPAILASPHFKSALNNANELSRGTDQRIAEEKYYFAWKTTKI